MEIEKVIITNISRNTLKLRSGEGKVLKVTSDVEMDIDFIFLTNNHNFESKTKLRVEEDKTIAELEEMIKDIMNGY